MDLAFDVLVGAGHQPDAQAVPDALELALDARGELADVDVVAVKVVADVGVLPEGGPRLAAKVEVGRAEVGLLLNHFVVGLEGVLQVGRRTGPLGRAFEHDGVGLRTPKVDGERLDHLAFHGVEEVDLAVDDGLRAHDLDHSVNVGAVIVHILGNGAFHGVHVEVVGRLASGVLEQVGGFEQAFRAEARGLDRERGTLAPAAHGAPGGVGDGGEHGDAAGNDVQLEQLGGLWSLTAEHIAENIVFDRTPVDDAGEDAGIEVVDVGHWFLLMHLRRRRRPCEVR